MGDTTSRADPAFACNGGCGLVIREGDRFVQVELRLNQNGGSGHLKNEGRYCCSACLQAWMETHQRGAREHAVICSAAERSLSPGLRN